MSRTITFEPGRTEQLVDVETNSDAFGELAEEFNAELLDASAGARIGVDTATIEIVDTSGTCSSHSMSMKFA